MENLIIFKFLATILSLAVFFTLKKVIDKKIEQFLKLIKDKDKKTLVELIFKITWYVILAIYLIILLQYWEINVTPLIAGLGIASLVVGLALQNTLSNFFSGLALAIDESIRIGDLIEIPEKKIVGVVESINWRSTRIRTLKNNIVYIPNSFLANTIVINYSQPKDEINVYVDVGVGYFEDLEKVENIVREVANEIQKTVPEAVKEWEPKIYFYKFGDSNIHFKVILRAKDFLGKREVVHKFVKKLKERFDKEGIEISFPNVNVFMRYGKENYELKF